MAKGHLTACSRCGILRERKITLCQDCRSVLTPAEKVLWVKKKLPVESYHEKKEAA